VVARKTTSNARRDEPKSQQGKGSSLFTGLLIGLVIGLVMAAGLAWYFNNPGPAFKTTDEVLPPDTQTKKTEKTDKANKNHVESTPAPVVETPPAEASSPTNSTPKTAVKPSSTPAPIADDTPSTTKPRVDYTFYGILPGDKPAKPMPPPKSKDIWWLQVAALKNPADADKLKARLTLLGLQVAMQKVESGDVALYRIRTGPYKREDDALGDLDTLAANNFEPRLFKEPTPPPAPQPTQEKP
jgi:cell division protein FtsN